MSGEKAFIGIQNLDEECQAVLQELNKEIEEYTKTEMQLQEEYETSVRLLNDTNKELKFKLNECEKVLQSLQDKVVKQQTDIDFLNEERKELRDNYEKSILHIQQLEEDGQLDAFNDISKGIFNCVSIEQIERVRKLFKKKDFAKTTVFWGY